MWVEVRVWVEVVVWVEVRVWVEVVLVLLPLLAVEFVADHFFAVFRCF